MEPRDGGRWYEIGEDDSDGLLRQGADGYQLTWMDAKVGDWVVTPRRGKAVEINALFYNALRLLAGWLKEEETGAWGPARALDEPGIVRRARQDLLGHCLRSRTGQQSG